MATRRRAELLYSGHFVQHEAALRCCEDQRLLIKSLSSIREDRSLMGVPLLVWSAKHGTRLVRTFRYFQRDRQYILATSNSHDLRLNLFNNINAQWPDLPQPHCVHRTSTTISWVALIPPC